MVARTGRRGSASRVSKRSKTRRRFDVALGTPGAEIRLPAIPHIRLGWRLLSGFLVVLLLSLLYTLWNSPIYKVKSAHVVGINRLNRQEINTVLKIEGLSIFAIEPRSLKQALEEAFPELYNISLQVQFPAKVVVSVTERQPIIAWHQDGVTFWVDQEGVAFPPHGEADLQVTVEAFTAPESRSDTAVGAGVFLSPELLSAILAVGTIAPPDSPVLFDQEHGLGWQDPRGWHVYFGASGQHMEPRLQVYQTIVENLVAEDIAPTMISVEHLHAPYFRLDR